MSEIARLCAAFTYGQLKAVVAADNRLWSSEVRLLLDLQQTLRDAQLMNADGTLGQAYQDALWRSYDVLPDALDGGQKLAILTDLHRAATIDGDLDPSEFAVVAEAAERLGVDAATLTHHFSSEETS